MVGFNYSEGKTYLESFKISFTRILTLLTIENCRLCKKEIIQNFYCKSKTDLREWVKDNLVNLDCLKSIAKNYESQTICIKCLKTLLNKQIQVRNLVLENSKNLITLSLDNYHGNFKNLIYRLKYCDDRIISQDLSFLCLKLLDRIKQIQNLSDLSEYVLIPVPMHKNKIKIRQYNQSLLIAQNLSKYTGIKVLANGLIKIKDTFSQQKLNAIDRVLNLIDSFNALESIVANKKIILIDDVITTGSTLKLCANTLYKAKAKEIVSLTIASSNKTN